MSSLLATGVGVQQCPCPPQHHCAPPAPRTQPNVRCTQHTAQLHARFHSCGTGSACCSCSRRRQQPLKIRGQPKHGCDLRQRLPWLSEFPNDSTSQVAAKTAVPAHSIEAEQISHHSREAELCSCRKRIVADGSDINARVLRQQLAACQLPSRPPPLRIRLRCDYRPGQLEGQQAGAPRDRACLRLQPRQ